MYFFLWFILGMEMSMQFFPLDMTVADRWFSFPMIGLLGMIGIMMQTIHLPYGKLNKNVLLLIGIILITVLSLRTMVRNSQWVDNMTLYTHDSKIIDNYMIESNLGVMYQWQSDFPQALVHYQKSVALFPIVENVSNLANVYILLGDKTNARKYIYQLLLVPYQTKEMYAKQLIFGSSLLINNDSPGVAKDFVTKALQKDPTSAALWAYLAISEYRLGNDSIALQHAKKATQYSNAPAYSELLRMIQNHETLPKNISILL